jgi:Leucine-rich repeat (LRR) protein
MPVNLERVFPNLKKIFVGQCGIKKIFRNVFSNLKKLEDLTLNYNNIESIERDSFVDLISLKELWITSNKLTTLDSGVFRNLRALETLSLNDNLVATFPTGLFDGMKNLDRLFATNNSLTTLQSGIFKNNRKLEFIDLHNNFIKSIHENVFDDTPLLRDVGLEENICISMKYGDWAKPSGFIMDKLRFKSDVRGLCMINRGK